jgi:hypothetical protein
MDIPRHAKACFVALGLVLGTSLALAACSPDAPVPPSTCGASCAGANAEDSRATLAISTKALPDAIAGVEYAASLEASGGTGPLSWTIVSGAPSGITLDASLGTLAGTPGTAGTVSLVVRVTDATSRSAEASLSLAVTPSILVAADGDFQAAIDAAMPGDTIVLKAGAVYRPANHCMERKCVFHLPNKGSDERTITITGSAAGRLPPGQRVNPSVQASYLPKIVSLGGDVPALRTDPGAHHFRLVGLEISPESPSAYVGETLSLGSLGSDQTTAASSPHHLVVDRCWVHGWPNTDYKRGIGLNSTHTDIINSYISDFHSDFQDSQAIGGFNGAGPFNIINNYLEGAGENIMFGGATSAIPNLVPSQISIKNNHFYKPWSWKNWKKVDAATYDATPEPQRAQFTYGGYAAHFIVETAGKYTPVIKNLFEIKNGQDVTLDGNIFENNWVQADQHGTAIVLTPRVENCAQPWAVVQRVTFTNNIVRNVGGLVSMLGIDAACQTSPRTNHITFKDNVAYNIRNEWSYDYSRIIQIPGIDAGVFRSNTIVHNSDSAVFGSDYFFQAYVASADTSLAAGIDYSCNVTDYAGGLAGYGNMSMPVLSSNVFIGGANGAVPGPNHYAAGEAVVRFADYAAGDFALSSTSPYKGLCDGVDPGANTAQVRSATASVLSGASGPHL